MIAATLNSIILQNYLQLMLSILVSEILKLYLATLVGMNGHLFSGVVNAKLCAHILSYV